MSVSIPSRGAVGIRKEASFASGGGIDDWQVVNTVSITPSHTHVYQDRIRNSPEQIGGRFANRAAAGQVTFPVSPQNPTQWWECGIGGSGPYTPQLPLSSMAIEVQEGDVAATYSSGDMISRIEFSSNQGDVLTCTVGLEGKDISARPAGTPSFASGDDPYLHSEATFTIDGVDNPKVTAFSVSKENNLVADLFANQTTRRDILATKAVVTGSISILFEETTHRNRFLNQLPSSITALWQRGSRSFQIDLVNINFDSREAPLEAQTAFIVETLPFTAFVEDPTSQNSIKLTVDTI